MVTQPVFHISPLNKRKRISMKTIRAIANHIAQRFDPEQVILFGSHAYGKPTPESDVDLLVIMDAPSGEMEAMVDIAKTLPILNFRVHVIVRSRETLEKRKKLGDWFLRNATQKGKLLYEMEQ